MENPDQQNGSACNDEGHWYTLKLDDQAECYAKIFTPPSSQTPGWNDAVDAFHHAYAAAIMKRDYGAAWRGA